MATELHPAASHHLPGFITGPGETDTLMVVSAILLVVIIAGIGVFYFKLHAIPEQIAHKSERIQFQIVAALSLLALFTHNHLYWVIALLLALVPLPDFSTPILSMAKSLNRLADAKAPASPEPLADAPPGPPSDSGTEPGDEPASDKQLGGANNA